MISRLKSLELQGYKTFANRTVFEFPGAVTAIVGPNGSGKSNITDALRWVLGEQSYSLLRGKKTEDMIFAGSDRRTRSGMATATVILDNSDNWLPIDYSEVAIARRAYRDGSNEYLLNGQKVRLRDVSELLAESGLAERTYTIIGQGLVDAALALRAEDRRRLFEEAAGIGLHRTRRQEAVRRLEDTQRNLERVEDILHELRPRLRSLERQARRAQEYDQAVEDLRVLLREWYGYHWHRAQKELSEAQSLANNQSTSLETTRQRELELDAEIGKLRDRRGELRVQLNDLHRQSAELHIERENTSRDLAVSEERSRNLIDQENNLKTDLMQGGDEVSLLQERLKFALEEVQELTAEFDEAQESSDSVRRAYESRLEERKKLGTGMSVSRQEFVRLSALREKLNSRQAEYQVQISSLRNSMQMAKQSNLETMSELEISKSKVGNTEGDLSAAKSVKTEIGISLEKNRHELALKRTELQSLRKTLSENEAEYAKSLAQAEVLKQAERNYAGYSAGARILLDSSKKSEQKGVKGLLGDRINVPREYEIAIGAALGEYIDAVLLHGSEDISQALSILEKKSEKGALLPLREVQPIPGKKDFGKEDGVIGRASELVETAQDLQPVVDTLIGKTWVVKDRKAAKKILSELRKGQKFERNASARFVTLLGEVFYATGQVRTSSGAAPASLSRPRQQEELQGKIAALENLVDEDIIAVKEIENEIQALMEKEQQLGKQLREATKKYEEAVSAHSQEMIALEKLNRDFRWREEQIVLFAGEIDAYQVKIERGSRELEKLDSEILAAQHQVDSIQEQLQNLPLDGLQTDLSHWSTRLEILQQGLRAAQSRLIEREQLHSAAATRLGSIEHNILQIQESRAELGYYIEELKKNSERIALDIESSAHKTKPAETALEEIETKLSEFLRLESKERVLTSQAEQVYTQAKITQIRKQEALDGLRRQIEADFGLVAFEYHDDVSGPTPLPLEGIVEDLPMLETLRPEIEDSLKRQRARLRRIGPINPEAQAEYQEVDDRYEFLSSQVNDLQEASEDVQRVIAELDEIMQREFCNTFDAVADEFHLIFGRLFGGGSARLILTDPDDLTNTGIDIEARLPGRREQGLSLLSGGERSLTAVALVFSLLRVSPTPFCVLDEVDAMLDEANVGRFRDLLRELSETTQFIMITHNRATVQVADIIYGVTMGRDSTSQILSLKVDELEKVIS